MTQSVQPAGTPPAPPAVAPAAAGARPAGGQDAGRFVVFAHAVMFVLGFTTVFTLLGAAGGLLGRSLNHYLPFIQKVGALLLILFALITMGVFSWLSRKLRARFDLDANPTANPAAAALVSILDWFSALLYTERRVTEMHNVSRRWGFASSFLLGVSFSAGWVPCIGPILASILFLAGNSATVVQGAILLAIYSLGLGVPFLITGLAFSRMTGLLRRLNRHAGVVSIVSGIFLLYVAYLLWFDRLATLTTRFAFLNEWVFALEDWVSAASGTGGDIISLSMIGGALLAFFAGLISFISPCVLPLVPAYLGFLTGAAVSGERGR